MTNYEKLKHSNCKEMIAMLADFAAIVKKEHPTDDELCATGWLSHTYTDKPTSHRDSDDDIWDRFAVTPTSPERKAFEHTYSQNKEIEAILKVAEKVSAIFITYIMSKTDDRHIAPLCYIALWKDFEYDAQYSLADDIHALETSEYAKEIHDYMQTQLRAAFGQNAE